MKVLRIGDKVVKNPETWICSEFDYWGAGEGVGEVVEPPFATEDYVDIRWPKREMLPSEERVDFI